VYDLEWDWVDVAIYIGKVYLFMILLLVLLAWYIDHTENNDDG
jgi:hypothetical protein